MCVAAFGLINFVVFTEFQSSLIDYSLFFLSPLGMLGLGGEPCSTRKSIYGALSRHSSMALAHRLFNFSISLDSKFSDTLLFPYVQSVLLSIHLISDLMIAAECSVENGLEWNRPPREGQPQMARLTLCITLPKYA